MRFKQSLQSGFTLVEIIVATALFVTVVASILALFNYVLVINRKVQAMRIMTQTIRNFNESLTREVRNGQIDYASTNPNCAVSNYASATNKSLAIVTSSGDKLCYYISSSALWLAKTQGGTTIEDRLTPSSITILDSFRFIIKPTSNPKALPYPGFQPMVTVVGEFRSQLTQSDTKVVPFQTTISTDSYDIPHN